MSRKTKPRQQHQIEKLQIAPYFDMEQFMLISQTKRLDDESARAIDEYWERWRELLRVARITCGQEQYLLVWLEQLVEEEINRLWETSPSRAFSINSLAQAMLMATIRDLVPEVAHFGCAPVPKPSASLRKALDEAGVSWTDDGALSKQYAMLTHAPFKGGCEICNLRLECPNSGKASVCSPEEEARP